MRVLVLGCGLVGSAIARDLSADEDVSVTVADINDAALDKISEHPKISAFRLDLADNKKVKKFGGSYDLIVSAVPGFLGFQTLKTLIEAGSNIIDIAFAAEDFMQLDGLAKEKNITAICDMGVAPGMSNLLAAYLAKKLDTTDKIMIYVGGLPRERHWPFEYKAVFSPVDLLEEYSRPARYVMYGQQVVKPALSDLEHITVKGIGTLEAFLSDGLRSLLTTLAVPNMVEKTLRYPGHVHKVEILKEAGFLSSEPMEINGMMVRPVDVTGKLLFPKIRFEEGDEDVTVMKVIAEGTRDGQPMRLCYELFDTFDKATGIHSMARTTGYTASVMARLVGQGLYSRKGVIAPEFIAEDENCVNLLLEGLAQRDVNYTYSEELL